MESNQNNKIFEKRFQSVRRLPQGQFNKYRQMFDAFTKRSTKEKANSANLNKNQISLSCKMNDLNQNDVNNLISTTKLVNDQNKDNNIMNMPYTDDEKSNHLYKSNFILSNNNKNLYYDIDNKMNFNIKANSKIFDGISDETNKLLDNLCSNNKQIAEFFEKPTNIATSKTNMNIYKAVPYHLIKNDIDLTKNDIYEATYEDSIITTTTTSNSFYTLNKNGENSSPTNSSSNSFSIYPADTKKYDNYDNLNTYLRMTTMNEEDLTKTNNNESNYFELDDVEFSDDSYEDGSYEDEAESHVDYDGDEDENLNDTATSITDLTNDNINNNNNNNNSGMPPPKPIRTFEHDVYVNSKDCCSVRPTFITAYQKNKNSNLVSYMGNQNHLYGLSWHSFKRNDKTRSLFNKILFGKENGEHVYETLPSVKEPSPTDFYHTNKNRIMFRKNSNYGTNYKMNNKDRHYNVENNDKMNDSFYNSKFTFSEPNLNLIGCQSLTLPKKPNKQEGILKPIGKWINTLKKTFSRMSINSDCESNNEEPIDINNNKNFNNRKISTSNSNDNKSNTKADIEFQFSSCSTVSTTSASSSSPTPSNHTSSNNNEICRISTKYVMTENDSNKQINSTIKLSRTLFHHVLIVGINRVTLNKSHSIDNLNSNDYETRQNSSLGPYVLWQFPKDLNSKLDDSIPDFCFPDVANKTEYKCNENEIFRFTLTNYDGSRTFGYCIRLCNRGKTPIVICIVSQIDALEMYHTILVEAEKIYLSSLNEVKLFLEAIYSKPLPNRGESVFVSIGLKNKTEFVLNRSFDRRLEHINLSALLKYPFDFIIKIFSAILMEKKLVFLSNKLSLLSNTIQEFETLLYPFSWPHTYIPLLPSYLIEMCEAPTPFIIGLVRSCKDELMKYNYENDLIIIDLDKQKIIQHPEENLNSNNYDNSCGLSNFLPENVLKTLKVDLYNLTTISKSVSESYKNMQLCKVFMKIFVKTIGNYKNYLIQNTSDNIDLNVRSRLKKNFMYNEFVNEAVNVDLKRFLEIFTKTQLFEVFISKKVTLGNKFAICFDESIKEESSCNIIKTSPKLTIKQISKN